MANLFWASLTSTSNITTREGDAAKNPLQVNDVISIILDAIMCPFTIVLNVLVIMAVKIRPSLRTNSNILLACLAVTDALTGLIGQPSYIVRKVFQIFDLRRSQTVENVHGASLALLSMASSLHLMLVTFERLLAIKFTMYYSNIVTDFNIKIAVFSVWISAFMCEIINAFKMYSVAFAIGSLITVSCVVFISIAYMVLYHKTRRHQKMIKSNQLPQGEVERLTKENKALKTTVFVVGAVVVCLLPLGFCLVVVITGLANICPIHLVWMHIFAMSNSLVNPLIYCWRQKETRKFVFGLRTSALHSAN